MWHAHLHSISSAAKDSQCRRNEKERGGEGGDDWGEREMRVGA